MKKLLLLLLLTPSFFAYALSIPEPPLPCESDDITEDVERFLEGFDEEEKAELYFITEQYLRHIDELHGGIFGWHCCSNSLLKACQELKEAE